LKHLCSVIFDKNCSLVLINLTLPTEPPQPQLDKL
jgi:hypothetical protein